MVRILFTKTWLSIIMLGFILTLKTTSSLYGQCNNFNLYPFGSQILVCGENLIADDVFAGDYFQTSGYVEGKAVLFTSSNPNDFITLKSTNGSIIAYGTVPLNITYQATYGDIMVHINKNDNCETRQVPRTITINNGCSCNNLSRYPFNTISLTCGLNTITNAQYAGEYNRTTGYIAERLYEYNSSFPSDHLTLRSSLDNSIIAEGFSPLFITYQNFMGDIEMHVNSNSFCGENNEPRTTTINADCYCKAPFFSASSVFVDCNDTSLYLSTAAEYKIASGFEIGQSYKFVSSIQTDYFVIRNPINRSYVASGHSPFTYVHSENYENPEIHILSDSLCNLEFSTRTIELNKTCDCYNETNFPSYLITLDCDTNFITSSQYAGEYNVTKGHIQGRTSIFTSSNASDFITLRKANGKALIAKGITPLSIVYDSTMGFIEMHINTDSFCGIQEINRTINIIRECIDLDTDGVDDAIDNCPGISNLFQSDLDQDGIGDACDEDESTLNNVGIGVENPARKLHIKDGDIYIDQPYGGVIFKTINGYCVKVRFSETEGLTYTLVDCPVGN